MYGVLKMHSFIRTYPSAASAASSSNISRSGEEDENGSICCDIYIDGEDNAQQQKGSSSKPLHVAAVLRGRGSPPGPLPEPEKQRICSCWRVTLIVVAVVVAAAVIGVSVGVSRSKQHQQHATGVPFGPGSAAQQSSSVTITVPFAATVQVEVPPGGLSCDALFGDEQTLEKLVDKLEAAHSRRMAQYQVDEVVVTELTCNNISYPVPAETFLTGKPAAAAAAAAAGAGGLPHRRRLSAEQQQQAQAKVQLTNGIHHSSSSSSTEGDYGSEEYLTGDSSSSSPKPLMVYVELEAKHREQLDKVPVISSHIEWVQKVSKAGAALAGQLVPEILAGVFNFRSGTYETTFVQQLNVEIISSQMMYDDIISPVSTTHTGRKGYKGSTVVTRTEIDPLTGEVIETQTMRLPVLPDYLPELLPDLPMGQDSSTTAGQQTGSTAEDQQTQPGSTAPTCVDDTGCGFPNTATSACVEGVCRVVACAPGWEDCDGSALNGCEANVLGFFSDDNHCGSCNKVCLAPLSCQLGKCAVRPPTAPTPDTTTTPEEPTTTQPGGEEQEPAQQQPGEQHQQQPAQGGDQAGEGKEEQTPGQETVPGEQQPGKQEPETEVPPQEQKPKPKPEGPATEVPALPPVTPSEPKVLTPTKPEGPKPEVPATKPETPPVKPPAKPHKPGKPLPHHVALRDDVAQISPSQPQLILDVIRNDDLRGADPAIVKLSVVAQPPVGTVTVLPVDGTHSRPRLLYKQGKDKLEPGSEVEIYYSVNVPGQPTPSPGTALILGAVAPSDSSLPNCSASAAATVRGTPIPALTRADDAAASVKLPFPVHMYGSVYTSATISSNGWVSMGSETGAKEPCNVEGSWPNAPCLGAGPVLAPFWDDLVADQVLTHHDTHLGAFVVQWTNAMTPAAKLPIGTFQAWLFANGTVGYVYRDLYGTEQALGSSAVVGIRGPTIKAKPYVAKLMSKAFENVGSGSDEHGSWLFSAALDEVSDYSTLLGLHRRILSPGMAVISHPVAVTGTPGKFHPWSAGSGSSSTLWPLLVSPDAPAQPVLQPLVAVSAAAAGAAGDNRVVTLTWDLPSASAHTAVVPTFYKLYLAADPFFNELLRQPSAAAFKPDIPPNSRSVDVELNGRHAVNDVYALLLACNAHACSRSCIGRYSLS